MLCWQGTACFQALVCMPAVNWSTCMIARCVVLLFGASPCVACLMDRPQRHGSKICAHGPVTTLLASTAQLVQLAVIAVLIIDACLHAVAFVP